MSDTPREPFASIPKMLRWRVEQSASAVAFEFRNGEEWETWTWATFGTQVEQVAAGLHSLGLVHGDRVAILANTRIEWITADLGILCAGGAVSTIYPSNTPEECAYILENSGSRICIAENEAQVAKLRESARHLLEQVFVLDGPGGDDGWVRPYADLLTDGLAWSAKHPGEVDRRADTLGPDDLATLIYTSGTTGKPKGVMLTHDCWCSIAESVDTMAADFKTDHDKQYLFLPLSHSFGKILEFVAIRSGFPTAINGDLNEILPGLETAAPTFMGAVPRVFEKVYNKIVTQAQAQGFPKTQIFHWSVRVGRQVSLLKRAGQAPSGWLTLKYWLATQLVFGKLKAAMGGQLRCFLSGGAPLSKEIAEFFHAADILILEGYGLTETSAASVGNRYEDYRFGTVGKPNTGVEVTLAEDGEILLRGRGIMRGYYQMPEATAEAFTEDGWFRSGDIGTFDDDGFLHITGRKKELIVTAGGKNIAPAHFENKLKAHCPLVSQVVMHGDRRNFCVALVTIQEEATAAWARAQHLDFSDYASLAALPGVHDEVWRYVGEVNAILPRYETVKYIALLDHDLSVETGELTPTLKVKRRIVEGDNHALLDQFYQDAQAS